MASIVGFWKREHVRMLGRSHGLATYAVVSISQPNRVRRE